MDFKDYQSQIKELISLRNAPDFNDLLNKILFGESNSDKFLIKMELHRLTTPCQRIIDLRDKVTEECQLFQQGSLKHYLTADTIKVLEENIELYGIYTVGVFEAVHFHLLQQKQSKKIFVEKAPKSPEQCEFIQLSQKNKRAAPRMFFVSEIELLLEDGVTISAQTSNISSTGIRIKLKEKIHIANQEHIRIVFTALQLEYQEPTLADKICYQIVKQTVEDNTHYLYLRYADDKAQFIAFLKEFIRENQYKYKIDVYYYYQLAQISALKNIYAAQMNILPIYLDSRSASPFLFALKNQANKQILNEWTCDGFNQLPILFDELRLTQLLAHATKKATTTLYCFTHNSNGKNYFLSASEEELLEKGLKNVFINYGSSKKSWRVYHLTINAYQYQQSQNYDITEPLPAEFASLTHIATIQPLTQLPSFSMNSFIDKKDLNKINQFVHRYGERDKASVYTLFSSEHRKEERYLYTSKLSLSVDNVEYSGEMVDFSLSGLKIKLDQAISIAASSRVTINLLALQKISSKYPLSHLKYKVIRNSPNNTLHLQVCDSKTLKVCNNFFSLLVQKNYQHFKCVQLKRSKQPAAKRLIEISEEAFVSCVFFIGKAAGRPKIKFAAIDQVDHSLYSLFSMCSDNDSELNYYPIANNHLYERLLTQPFKECDKNAVSKEAFIYVKAYKNEENRWSINSFLDTDFQSEKEKIEFITRTAEEGKFYALHYRLSALKPGNLKDIESEIHTISRFAIHLVKKLEEQLHEINAMVEVTDRTLDVLQAIKNG